MAFETLQDILRTLGVGVLAYAALIVLLRISGKRTLSKMNAFDLVVTVALGSTLASILLSPDTGLAQGITALALLVALQYAITRLSVRWHWWARRVKASPRLLFHRGRWCTEAMEQERVLEGEILQAMRAHGIGDTGSVHAVVLETDGSLSVIRQGASEEARSTLGKVSSGA